MVQAAVHKNNEIFHFQHKTTQKLYIKPQNNQQNLINRDKFEKRSYFNFKIGNNFAVQYLDRYLYL